jgi:hypothetical protein
MDDLRLYLLNTRINLLKKNREDIPIDDLMVEISNIASENWVCRDNGKPDLTTKQLLTASRRVIAKIYNKN